MRIKWWHLFGLVFLAVVPVHGQPTNGPVYWSATQPDCSSLGETTPVTITNPAGATIGYSCYVSGTFVWFAAGGIWDTTIRAAAPASGSVGVDYTFFDQGGTPLSLDTTINNVSSSLGPTSEVEFSLSADQPAELELLGAAGNGPTYATTVTGSVYAVFYCPDAVTCGNVLPQLLYSALPTQPWALSVPIAFDYAVSNQWSAVGINDNNSNAGHVMSLVIYNEDVVANTYKVSVFDSTGTLVGTGVTPSIAPLANLGNGNYGGSRHIRGVSVSGGS